MSLLRETLDEARATHRKEADAARAELFESQRNAKQAEEVAQRQISELLRAAENAQKVASAILTLWSIFIHAIILKDKLTAYVVVQFTVKKPTRIM
jgi:hypothetical protein